MRVILQCLAPVSHGAFGESAGNAVLCRRIRLVSHPSRPRVGCVSGNALRGVLRRLVFRELLIDRCPGLRESLTGKGWDRLYAALANGGHLAGEGKNKLVPDDVRALRAALPPLSLFGAALYTWMLPGHMSVGILWPRCRETHAAGVTSEPSDVAAEDLVEEISHCRHVDREQQDPEISGVTPMPTTIEVLSPGTVLESEVLFARHASAEERGAFLHGLELLHAIGGKQAAGFGRVAVASETTGSQAYRDWLDGTPDLADRLAKLAKELV